MMRRSVAASQSSRGEVKWSSLTAKCSVNFTKPDGPAAVRDCTACHRIFLQHVEITCAELASEPGDAPLSAAMCECYWESDPPCPNRIRCVYEKLEGCLRPASPAYRV